MCQSPMSILIVGVIALIVGVSLGLASSPQKPKVFEFERTG
jgi:hypothetical protein